MKQRAKLLLIVGGILVGCQIEAGHKYEIQYKIVAAKTKETSDSRLYYLIAFTDGYTESTSYGFYNCLQIGDSVRFYRGNLGGWKMDPKCSQK